MIFVDVEQGSEDWHALRRTKIGASNSPALLGIHPYKTSSDVYDEMMSGKKTFVNSAMRVGTEKEPVARDQFNEDNKLDFKPAVVLNKLYPYMMASLDGISTATRLILEIKCPGEKVFDSIIPPKVPAHWEYQIQHQLAMTGYDKAVLFVFMDDLTFKEMWVFRDEDKIKEIANACNRFMNENILEYKRPEELESYEERNDDEWAKEVGYYLSIKNQIAALTEIEKMKRESIIELCNGRPSKGSGIRVERSVVKGTVDYSLVEELKEVNLDQYRRPSREQWRICEVKD